LNWSFSKVEIDLPNHGVGIARPRADVEKAKRINEISNWALLT
jgi:hypothetical protein